MPVRLEWDNAEKTILCHIYEAETRLEDYYYAIERSAQMLEEVDHTVHIIMDNTLVEKRPAGLMDALRKAGQLVPPNQGIRVVVAPTEYSRMVIESGKDIAPTLVQHVYFAESVEQARQIIADRANNLLE